MIDESMMYWLTRMDYICNFLVVIGGITAIFGLGFLILVGCAADPSVTWPERESIKRFRLVSILLLSFSLVVLAGRVFVPTTKEMAAIKVVPMIANNDRLREECDEVYSLCKQWVKDTLEENATKKAEKE